MSLFYASTCFEHMCCSSGGQKLYYTVSGIITPIGGRLVHRLVNIKINILRCTVCKTLKSFLVLVFLILLFFLFKEGKFLYIDGR